MVAAPRSTASSERNQLKLNTMCDECYEGYEGLPIINEKTKKAAELIKELYDTDGGGVGGYGHIVFDDFNIEDGNVDWCIEEAKKGKYDFIPEEGRQASLNALIYFKELSEDERMSAIGIAEGRFEV